MPSKQYNVFISYSHKDGEACANELAERIKQDNRGTGITFWKDYDNMRYGQWSKQIEKAIDSVEFLIMIITPEALASPNCKDEWMYARKNGVCILPVNGNPNDINFYNTFPKWLEKQHIYTLEKQWDRFINDLNTKPQVEPVPFMAPRITTIPDYVPRKEELSQIKNLVLNGSNGNTVSITTTLQGSGGFGKTTLAIALCNDDDIINHFDDGILWVTLGQQAGTARDALNKLYRGLSRDETSFIDVEEAQQRLAEKMEKRNSLVVIDDVWKPQDLKQITDSLGNCGVLITTRFAYILPQQQVQQVKVDEMKTAESVALLTGKFKAKVQNRKAFEELAEQLGHWPLVLKLTNAQITKRVLEGESPEQALAFIQKKYVRKGITGFDQEDVTQREDSVKKSLDASIELLKSDERDKLLQLGIFPDDEIIPYDIISLLWDVDDFDTEATLEKLHSFALLDLDYVNKTCSIHDVLLHYYNEQLGKTTAAELHEKLITSLHDFKTIKNQYYWKWYVWHLVQAGRIELVTHILRNLDWIEFKLFATNITELLKDYEHLSLDSDTDLIYRALKLSAHVLAEDKNQLPSQLIGRLGYFENEPLMQLLKKAKMWKKMSWVRPIMPSLTPPGNLLRILRGHTGGISSLLFHENKIISGSFDGTLRIWEIKSGQCLQTLVGHTGGIRSLLIQDGKIITGSEDSTIRIWEMESGQCLQTLEGHTEGILSILVRDNKIISGSYDSTIRIWQMESGHCLQILKGHRVRIRSLLVHEGKIISGSYDSTIRIWEMESGQCLQTLKGHRGRIRSLLVHEGKIISGSHDNSIRIWEIESGRCLNILQGHTRGNRTLLIHGDKIISGSDDRTIRIWEIESGKCIQTFQGHTNAIRSLLVYEGKIISGSDDRTIRIWEIESGKCIQTLVGHTGRVRSLLVHDNKIISGSDDKTILIWDIDFGQSLQPQQGHTGRINSLLIQGNKIISGSDDSTIRIVKIETGRCIQILQGHTSWIRSLVVQDNKIISGSDDSTIRIWDGESGLCLQTLLGHKDAIRSLLSQKGKIISGSNDFTLRIWELESGQCIQILQGHKGRISSVLVHDNKIISGSYDGTIRIWEIESGQCLQTLEGHKGRIGAVLVQANKIISGSYDGTIRIWEIESGECLQTLQGHEKGIGHLCVQANKIISGSFDSTIRIWEIESGRCLHTLQGHTGGISSLLLHGDKIISGSDDRTIRIWEIENGQCLQTLEGHAGWINSLLVQDNNLISTDSSGLLILYDVIMFIEISRYYSDAVYTSQTVFHNNRIISGDKSGQLHILEMIDI